MSSRYQLTPETDETGPWVMNDMVLTFSAIMMILAMIFLLILRMDEFSSEYEQQLLQVDADNTTEIVYEPEKALETERLALDQPERQEPILYQGNYGGTITEELSRIDFSPDEFELVRVRLFPNGSLYYQGQQYTAQVLVDIINKKAGDLVVFLEIEVEQNVPFSTYAANKQALWDQSAADHFRTILVN